MNTLVLNILHCAFHCTNNSFSKKKKIFFFFYSPRRYLNTLTFSAWIQLHWHNSIGWVPASCWSWHWESLFVKWCATLKAKPRDKWLSGPHGKNFPLLPVYTHPESLSALDALIPLRNGVIIKSQYRSCLAVRHLTDCIGLATKHSDSIQSQPSHWLQEHICISFVFRRYCEKWCCARWELHSA